MEILEFLDLIEYYGYEVIVNLFRGFGFYKWVVDDVVKIIIIFKFDW